MAPPAPAGRPGKSEGREPKAGSKRHGADGDQNKGSALGIPTEGRQRNHGAKAETLKAEMGWDGAGGAGGEGR